MMFWLPEGVLVDPCCALLVARLSVQSLQRCQGDDEPTSAFHAFSCFTVNFTVYTVFILQRFLMVWDECFSLSRGLSRLSSLHSFDPGPSRNHQNSVAIFIYLFVFPGSSSARITATGAVAMLPQMEDPSTNSKSSNSEQL